jgi:hypothetical protein
MHSSDRGGLPGETSCGHLGDPEIWDEGSGGNAGASRTRSGSNAGTRASHSQEWLGWKGAQRRNMLSRRAPDSNLRVAGFKVLFYKPCAKEDRAFSFSGDLAA